MSGTRTSGATSGWIRPRRILSQMLAAGLLAAGLSVAVAGAAAADGNTLYASPSGSGDCSSQSSPCSLATALADATAGDSISLLAGTYAGTNYTIASSVTIEPAPGVANPVLSDDAEVSLFFVDPGVTATMSGLDLTTGGDGMGIFNEGTLTVEDCNIYDNGGGDGGGIENGASGTLSVESSAIYGNGAASGGGIFNNEGFMSVENSTISDNFSATGGGGIVNYVGTSVIEDSTISGNFAAPGYGAGIYNLSGTTTLASTIVAGGSGGECAGTVSDDGYNIDDDGTCGFSAPGSVSGSPAIDDYLGLLGSYGGPTQTVPLLSSPSPATTSPDPALGVVPGTFDLPDGTGACSGADQRGVGRQAPCDMGAFELQETDLTLSASAPTLSPGGSVTYTATVGPVPDGGTVAFSDGAGNPATVSCAAQPVSAGVARCTVTYPDAGGYSVSAAYSGDTDFASSAAGPITQAVGTAVATATLLTFGPSTLVYGSENVERFTVAVLGRPGDGYPKGTAVVSVGGGPVCTIALTPGLESSGSCFLSASGLSAGVYSVSARYIPAAPSSTDPLYYYTTSLSLSVGSLTVNRDPTTTSVSVSPTAVAFGSEQKAVFSVTVRTFNAKNVPTAETVTVHIGSGGVNCSASLTAGKGTCSISGGSELGKSCTPPGGAYSFAVTASYAGDVDFGGSAVTSTRNLLVFPPAKAPPCL